MPAKSIDEWWYALAQLAASMDGHCLEELCERDGVWPSEEARRLFGEYIDRGVAAYDVLSRSSSGVHSKSYADEWTMRARPKYH